MVHWLVSTKRFRPGPTKRYVPAPAVAVSRAVGVNSDRMVVLAISPTVIRPALVYKIVRVVVLEQPETALVATTE